MPSRWSWGRSRFTTGDSALGTFAKSQALRSVDAPHHRDGGTIPALAQLQSLLRIPTTVFGWGLGERIHAANERLKASMFAKGRLMGDAPADPQRSHRRSCRCRGPRRALEVSQERSNPPGKPQPSKFVCGLALSMSSPAKDDFIHAGGGAQSQQVPNVSNAHDRITTSIDVLSSPGLQDGDLPPHLMAALSGAAPPALHPDANDRRVPSRSDLVTSAMVCGVMQAARRPQRASGRRPYHGPANAGGRRQTSWT